MTQLVLIMGACTDPFTPCNLASPSPPPLSTFPAGITYDMHQVLDVDSEKHNQIAQDIWANAEVFDWRAETVFKYIQVFTVSGTEACVQIVWSAECA